LNCCDFYVSEKMGEGLYSQNSFKIPPYILDDLCTRFIINLPGDVGKDNIRIFFQIELAHWFYLDFYCPDNPDLKTLNIKEFSTQIFRHCPNLVEQLDNFDTILDSWKEYKQAVPTYGAIMLDPSLQYCLLVQGFWDKASWGFPKGKINENEAPVDCAIREVLEETGFNIKGLINPNLYLEHRLNEQIRGLYIIPGVPMETKFQAKTRQEIKSFGWFRVDSLPSHKKDLACKQQHNLSPNAFFMVIPFVKGLRQWINAQLCGIDLVSSSTLPPQSAAVGRFPPHPLAGGGGILFSAESLRHSTERRHHKQSPYSMDFAPVELFGSPRDPMSLLGSSFDSKLRTKSESPPYRLNTKSSSTKLSSPRQTKKHNTTHNKSSSPVKPPTAKSFKPVKILKRDRLTSETDLRSVSMSERQGLSHVTLTQDQSVQERQGHMTQVQPVVSEKVKDLTADYVCPAWRDFKLDIDQVLAAMFHNVIK